MYNRYKQNSEKLQNFASKLIPGVSQLFGKRPDLYLPGGKWPTYYSKAKGITVWGIDNKKYYDLIDSFFKKTACPVIVNTSFNVRGEPIVNTPLDAFNCFMGTDLDNLIIGNCFLEKSEQNLNLKKNYLFKFEKD